MLSLSTSCHAVHRANISHFPSSIYIYILYIIYILLFFQHSIIGLASLSLSLSHVTALCHAEFGAIVTLAREKQHRHKGHTKETQHQQPKQKEVTLT